LDCPSLQDATPKSALCSENHPVNYKGVSIYRGLNFRKKLTSISNLVTDNTRYKSSNVQSSHPPNDASSNKHPPSDKVKLYTIAVIYAPKHFF